MGMIAQLAYVDERRVEHTDHGGVPPLDRASRFARRAVELATRAQREAGVMRRARRLGDPVLEHDAREQLRQHLAGAQFVVALMSSAIQGWQEHERGRVVPAAVLRLAARAHSAVQAAQPLWAAMDWKPAPDAGIDP